MESSGTLGGILLVMEMVTSLVGGGLEFGVRREHPGKYHQGKVECDGGITGFLGEWEIKVPIQHKMI